MDAKTKLCAVIGNPIGHSLSPQIHNAAFAELRLNFAYVAFQVEDVAAAMAGVRGLGIVGLSITIPHKVTSMAEMDQVDPVAQGIGCINTVHNVDGKLVGYNTDGLGAMNSLLEAGCKLDGSKVLVLGSGGAARAIAVTLAHKCELNSMTILGVIKDEREKLAQDVAAGTEAPVVNDDVNEETLAEHVPSSDVIIHCTPIGMHPKTDDTLVPEDLFREGQTVFDAVYNPLETVLLKQASAKKCRTIRGMEMFVRQAVAQFELWTGETAPYDVMAKVVRDALESKA